MNVLDRIMAVKRAEVAAAKDALPLAELNSRARRAPPCRDFVSSLRKKIADGSAAVIAEIKRASPSRGVLRENFHPAEIAKSYEAGGAACLSVLTDRQFFQGAAEHLQVARNACALPVLRKDFTVSPFDVVDARLMGADCLLLIASAMRSCMLADLYALAIELGLDVLVEVHDENDLEVAMHAEATMIGVNQRDLFTFEVDHDRAVRMVGVIPDGVVKVAESGVRGADDARMLSDAGYDAILVGETLVTAADPRSAIVDMRVRPT